MTGLQQEITALHTALFVFCVIREEAGRHCAVHALAATHNVQVLSNLSYTYVHHTEFPDLSSVA
jgi:hypothetical protein